MFQQAKAKMNSIKNSKSDNWSSLSPAEKKLELFRRQKDLLDTFLSTGAISQAQHDKSLNCLIEKMGIKEEDQWPETETPPGIGRQRPIQRAAFHAEERRQTHAPRRPPR